MRKKKMLKRGLSILCLSGMLVAAGFLPIGHVQTVSAEEAAAEIELSDAEDFFAFVENCRYDGWSSGKTVRLTSDLDLGGKAFKGVPYFNGVFEGNGYKIVNVKLTPKGSDYGFFRYIGAEGIVKNLHVSGMIKPSGSQKNIGGVVGVNYGTVIECSFAGEVSGISSVGGIAGYNAETGTITGSESNALVLATNYTGGIAGSNAGVISACVSQSHVNIEELDPTFDLGGMDMSSFNVAHSMINRNDMGGIAGYSQGVITDCANGGNVGYQHTGYNVGGIVGRQCGIVLDCVNRGEISGRKDIGGIVGQAEPYIESEYLEDKVNQTKHDIHRLNQTLRDINTTVSETSTEIRNFAEDTLPEKNENGEITPEQLTESISQHLQSTTREQELKDIAKTVDEGAQSVAKNVESALDQLNHMAASMSNDIAAMTSDEEIVEDISSVQTAEGMDGVISGCENVGNIHGDRNTGGIAGTMNVEYGGDPEFDFDFSDSLNVTLRSTVNNVVIHCVNRGEIVVKKNYAGGISGLQELGFIYDCEGYGSVNSENGNYLGGIAGSSMAAIEKSYSLCNVAGTDYVGGICGSGYTVKESVSVCEIESEGERIGSIAGDLQPEGTATGNLFVSEQLHGVDDISYEGVAEKVSYEEVIERSGMPERFRHVTVTFKVEDAVLAQKEIPYGARIVEADFPEVREKEGYYVRWPEEAQLCGIRKNMTVTAEYVPWTESVASTEETEGGRPVCLAVAEFYENTKLLLKPVDGPERTDKNARVAYAYAWELSSDKEKRYDRMELHLIKPETEDVLHVLVKENGAWKETAAQEDGSYLVVTLPYGAEVAVVAEPETVSTAAVASVCIVVLLVGLLLVWRRRKKKEQKQNSGGEAE